jgi:predicted DNA-binding transcriptional regulator YafY
MPARWVHSGFHRYHVAFDVDRDAWRTFRVDRIRAAVRLGGRARSRPVPGSNPAAFVNEQLRSGEPEIARGRIRMSAPAAQVKARIPERWAIVEALEDSACVVTSTGRWSQTFLVRVALLGVPIEILGLAIRLHIVTIVRPARRLCRGGALPPVFVGSRGVFKGEYLRHLDA